MADDEERPHNVFDGGRSVSFSENDLGSVNVWEALCRRNHGASSLHPWNPRPRFNKSRCRTSIGFRWRGA